MPMVRVGTPYVLRRRIALRPRGMGQTTAYLQDPCDCFQPLSGVPNSVANPNNKPQCGANGLAPGCTQDEPPCNGIAYGQPGYAECYASLGESAAALAQQTSNLAQMGIQYTVPTYTGPNPAVATPAQSNAPAPAKVAKPTKAAAQSNATGSIAQVPSSSSAPIPGATPNTCFSLFAGESCIGPIGATTALVVGGGILGLFFLFGRHK